MLFFSASRSEGLKVFIWFTVSETKSLLSEAQALVLYTRFLFIHKFKLSFVEKESSVSQVQGEGKQNLFDI